MLMIPTVSEVYTATSLVDHSLTCVACYITFLLRLCPSETSPSNSRSGKYTEPRPINRLAPNEKSDSPTENQTGKLSPAKIPESFFIAPKSEVPEH